MDGKTLSLKLKYVGSALNEKIAQWGEKRAHKNFQKAEAEILRFKDMGCFGHSEKCAWECGYFHQNAICGQETCPMQNLNKSYVSAFHVWNHAKSALYKTNSLANAVREDMGMKKVR